MVAQRIRDYEIVVILSPEATEDEVAASLDQIDVLVTERGGEVTERDIWGLKRMAYPIKKYLDGQYVLLKFKVETGHIAELNRILGGSEDILRFLITKT